VGEVVWRLVVGVATTCGSSVTCLCRGAVDSQAKGSGIPKKGSVSFTKTCKGRDRCLTDLQRSPTELHVVGTSYNTETSVLHSTAPSEYLR
jgi:hypothetical protein